MLGLARVSTKVPLLVATRATRTAVENVESSNFHCTTARRDAYCARTFEKFTINLLAEFLCARDLHSHVHVALRVKSLKTLHF